jgi:T4 RnlA family RNA ligase
MNGVQRQLYDNLMQRVAESEAFFYVDQMMEGVTFRIFNYRLASYSEFMEPGAIECRGVMFEMDGDEPVRLAARPMEKFFNYRENPLTMDVDLSTVTDVWDKADGSLISTYTINGQLYAKSKGSLHSDQAVAATKIINEDLVLNGLLLWAEGNGFTVNMEYVAPTNRIVIGYDREDLIVLNARNRETGEYVDHDYLEYVFGHRVVKRYDLDDQAEMLRFFEGLPDMTGIEGVVVRTADGLHMKMKTEAYMTAHRAKDSINSPRRLFEAVLEEATDDLRSLFYDDPQALAMIAEMEEKVEGIYNHLVDTVERFYERNKHLDRKSYAILGQEELEGRTFGLAMQKYTGRQVDYKDFLRRRYKDFGIKDDPEVDVDD